MVADFIVGEGRAGLLSLSEPLRLGFSSLLTAGGPLRLLGKELEIMLYEAELGVKGLLSA